MFLYNVSLLCTPIYILLLVSLIPATKRNSFFFRLASHGKLRQSSIHRSGSQSRTRRSTWSLACQVETWTVSKQKFTHFYRWGSVWSIVVGIIILCSGDGGDVRIHWPTWWLVLFQVIRRLYECEYVHIFRGTMHLFAYILGLVHYTLLPLVLLFGVPQNYGHSSRPSVVGSHLVDLALYVICMYAQYQQCRHHVQLANLRRRRTNHISFNNYSIPAGNGFEYTYCPHYFAEIIIYGCFASLLHRHKKSDQEGILSRNYNHLFLWLWVLTNLAVSAHRSKTWYVHKDKCPDREKAALIPFIW